MKRWGMASSQDRIETASHFGTARGAAHKGALRPAIRSLDTAPTLPPVATAIRRTPPGAPRSRNNVSFPIGKAENAERGRKPTIGVRCERQHRQISAKYLSSQ